MKLIRSLGVLLAFSLMTVACSGAKSYGKKFPTNLQIVRLNKIQSNPAVFKDKDILLQGNYGMYCCPSDFSYKEGLEGVEVMPVGFPTPKAARGKLVKIYGTVRLGKHVEEEKKESEKEEAGEERHADFYIEAKGVQFP